MTFQRRRKTRPLSFTAFPPPVFLLSKAEWTQIAGCEREPDKKVILLPPPARFPLHIRKKKSHRHREPFVVAAFHPLIITPPPLHSSPRDLGGSRCKKASAALKQIKVGGSGEAGREGRGAGNYLVRFPDQIQGNVEGRDT